MRNLQTSGLLHRTSDLKQSEFTTWQRQAFTEMDGIDKPSAYWTAEWDLVRV